MPSVRRPKRVTSRTPKQQKSFIDTLNPDPIPDPEPRVIHKSVGRKTKLGISTFLWNLFKANEDLPHKRKLTNSAIELAVRDEFQHRRVLIDSLDRNNSSVNDWRRRYNRGILVPSFGKPERVSLRYDNEGDPVEPRLGRRKLTPRDIAILCDQFEIKDDRYQAAITALKKE